MKLMEFGSAEITAWNTWGVDLSGSLQGAGGVGGLLMVEEYGSTTDAYHFHYDGNGNVTRVSDAVGAVAASYRYDAFGNVLTMAGPYAAANKYRFSTKPVDLEIAGFPLYYYGYRFYDAVTGRWLSRDPIGEAGGINLYEFCLNNPLKKWDYLGNITCTSPKVKDPDGMRKCDEEHQKKWQMAEAAHLAGSKRCMSAMVPIAVATCMYYVRIAYIAALIEIYASWNRCHDAVPCVCPPKIKGNY